MFLEIGTCNFLTKFEKSRANSCKLSVLNVFFLLGWRIRPVCSTTDVVKHLIEDHFIIIQLFVLLLEFNIHLAKWTQPLVDHKSAQNEILNCAFYGVKRLCCHLFFGAVVLLRVIVHHVFIGIIVERSKHLELCLQHHWHINVRGLLFSNLVVL